MIKTKTYPSGMRLVVEEMPGVKSVAVNMFINAGSNNENSTNRGVAHFVEHMLFQDDQFKKVIPNLTSNYNASTFKNWTYYHAQLLPEDVTSCTKTMSNIFFKPKFEDKTFNNEKGAITQEIINIKENAEIISDRVANKIFYKGTPEENYIIGTAEEINKMSKEILVDFYKKNYVPENLILSFAGNITFEECENLTDTLFAKNFNSKNKPNYTNSNIKCVPKAQFTQVIMPRKENEIVIKFPTFTKDDNKNFAVELLSIILGDNTNSRLFDKLRNDNGLVYYVATYNYQSNYGSNLYIPYTTSKEKTAKATYCVGEVINKLINDKKYSITSKELEIAKKQFMLNKSFGSEFVTYNAYNNSNNLIDYNRVIPIEESIENIKKVTLEEINNVAKEIFTTEHMIIVSVGEELKVNLIDEFKKGFNKNIIQEDEKIMSA